MGRNQRLSLSLSLSLSRGSPARQRGEKKKKNTIKLDEISTHTHLMRMICRASRGGKVRALFISRGRRRGLNGHTLHEKDERLRERGLKFEWRSSLNGQKERKKKKGREEEIGLDSHALFLFLFSTHPVAGRKEGERERVVDTMAAIAAIAPRADGDEKDEDTRPTKSGGAAAAVSER